MFKALPLTAVVLFVFAQGAAPVGEVQFSAARMKAHMTFLADDELEGREAGSRGHEIAARYVAAQFALDGVQPAGRDGTYYEAAQFAETSVVTPRPVLRVTTPAGSLTFEHGDT